MPPGVLQIPEPYTQGTNTFSIDAGGNITLTNSNNQQNPLQIGQLNTQSMNEIAMLQRFFADIVKDSQADYKLGDVIQILQSCFPNHANGPNRTIPVNIAAYKLILQTFDNRVFNDNNDNITILKNILKTSSVGSNIKISDALWALYESGFGCSSVSRNATMKTVKTSAATLDSLLKQPYDVLFNPNVIFDQQFSRRLGIPDGFTWSSSPVTGPNFQQKSNVTIQFWNPPPGAAADAMRSGIIDNEENTPVARGFFNGIGGNGDIMGNKPKNEEIHRLMQNNNNIPRIKRLFIIKEIGDVLQVWMYLALIKMMNFEPIDVVMVTTDSVVYLFCVLLGLSCIYTGERTGVRPGCCTLRHYLAGRPNYLKKYENMIEVYATRLIQHNTSISMGLLRLIADPSNFDYYIVHGGNPGYRRTIASKGLTSDIQSTRVNPLIRRFIRIIDTSTERVKLALKLVKTYIATLLQLPPGENIIDAHQNAINEMQLAQQETHVNAIQLDGDDHVDVQNAVAAVRAAAATALVNAASLLESLITATTAVQNAQTRADRVAAETAINDGYIKFCNVVDPLKQESMLTLLPNKRYIILPAGQLLTAFVNFTNPPPGSVRLIDDVSPMIAGAAVAADAQRQFNQALRAGQGGGRGQQGGMPKKQRVAAHPAVVPLAAAAPTQFRLPNETDIANEDSSTYNECLVACYIQATRNAYDNLHLTPDRFTLKGNRKYSINYFDRLIGRLFTPQNPPNFDNLFREQSRNVEFRSMYSPNNYNLQIAFALDYDKFANALIREQNLEFDERHGYHGRTPNRKLLEDYFDSLSSDPNPHNHISRSLILKRGKQLLRFLHLAQDIIDEISSLNTTITNRIKIIYPGHNPWIQNVNNGYNIPNTLGINDWIIDTRFHSWLLRTYRHENIHFNVPFFNPSTICGGLRDPITYSLIDPALAIQLTIPTGITKCYQITTIVDYLIKNQGTLDTLLDLSTQAPISDQDKQNIANFIIMMYKLTPVVQEKLGRFLQQALISSLQAYNREPAAAALGGARGTMIPRVSGTKKKTIKRNLHYKNKSKNQKILNKHRMTRRNNIKTHRRTRKHRN